MPLRLSAHERDRRRAVAVNPIADAALRQDRFLLLELRRGIVAAFDVGATEAGKLDRLAACSKDRGLAVGTLGRNLERRPQHPRIHHLRRHRALPDQLVDSHLVWIEHAFELARRQAEVGGTNRFVRFLRVLDARLIAARSVVVVGAEHLANHARRLVDRLVGQRRGVGSMVGDETFHLTVTDVDALEQPLRHLHRSLGGEPELAAGFLRQR